MVDRFILISHIFTHIVRLKVTSLSLYRVIKERANYTERVHTELFGYTDVRRVVICFFKSCFNIVC